MGNQVVVRSTTSKQISDQGLLLNLTEEIIWYVDLAFLKSTTKLNDEGKRILLMDPLIFFSSSLHPEIRRLYDVSAAIDSEHQLNGKC